MYTMDDSKPWTHRSDLALLAFMKAFEAHIERRQQHITTSLQVVSTAVTDLSTNLSRISASSALLSNETFFEKVNCSTCLLQQILWKSASQRKMHYPKITWCFLQQVESWDDLVNSRIGGGVAISEGTKQTVTHSFMPMKICTAFARLVCRNKACCIGPMLGSQSHDMQQALL
jgi:hypothetical protein